MKTSSKTPPSGRAQLARSFRRRATKGESLLWGWLRSRGLGVKFRRQVPVGPYIVDFLSLEVKLIVEVDGSHHGKGQTRERDQQRDQFLQSEGYEVVRFWDRDILSSMEECLQHLGERIDKQRKKLAQNPPSPVGRRQG